MTELVDFLKQRLDEDQAAAEQAASGSHDSELDRDDFGRLLIRPDRMLAQVAAMRAIVAAHEVNCTGHHDWPIDPTSVAPDRYDRAGVDVALWHALRHLAAIWASHPDYDPAVE